MTTITEADRATARRVLCRWLDERAMFHVSFDAWAFTHPHVFQDVALAAAQGRAYAAALRGAK